MSGSFIISILFFDIFISKYKLYGTYIIFYKKTGLQIIGDDVRSFKKSGVWIPDYTEQKSYL